MRREDRGDSSQRARFGLVLALAAACLAGEFEGLRPGGSTKADADRVLGAPVREVVPGERYDYDPARHDARRISLRFNRQTQVIEAIDLYFKTTHDKAQYQKWFKLGQPFRTGVDANGNLIEYYQPAGVSLHYTGPDASAPVEFFSHFDSALLAEQSGAGPGPGGVRLEAVKRPYLGVMWQQHSEPGVRILVVYPGSPAQKAGLQPGDVVLEIERTGFYQTGAHPAAATALIRALPPGQPVRLLVSRRGAKFEMRVPLDVIDEEAFALESGRWAHSRYEEGRKRLDRKDYDGAIEAFQMALALTPSDKRDAGTLELLGFCYVRKQRYAEGLAAFNRAYQLNPQSPTAVYHLAVCHEGLRNREQAVQYYRAYLNLNHGNAELNRQARRRLDSLTREPRPKPDFAEQFDKALDAIRQEIERSRSRPQQ